MPFGRLAAIAAVALAGTCAASAPRLPADVFAGPQPLVIRGQSLNLTVPGLSTAAEAVRVADHVVADIARPTVNLAGGIVDGVGNSVGGTVDAVSHGRLPSLGTVLGSRGRLRFDYFDSFDGGDDDLSRFGFQALTRVGSGPGLDIGVEHWEPGAGASPGRGDSFQTGDANLLLNWGGNPRLKLRTGAGLAWTNRDPDGPGPAEGDARFGYNVTSGFDLYLLGRAMLSVDADYGEIDGDSLRRTRSEVGWTWQRFELFAGYEEYRLGAAGEQGFVGGLRLWY